MNEANNKAIQKLSLQSSVLIEQQFQDIQTLQSRAEALNKAFYKIKDDIQNLINNLQNEIHVFMSEFKTLKRQFAVNNTKLQENECTKLKHTILNENV